MFQASFHSVLTLLASWYAPPDTGGSKFATSCRRIPAINRRCRPGLLVCTFLHWILLFCTHQRLPFQGPIPPIRGKCPEGTKGVGMLSPKVTERLLHICGDLSVSASPSHLPWEGRPWGTHSNGFPYEGKLSAVRLTDEVDTVSLTQVLPPHPSRLRRATFPS